MGSVTKTERNLQTELNKNSKKYYFLFIWIYWI